MACFRSACTSRRLLPSPGKPWHFLDRLPAWDTPIPAFFPQGNSANFCRPTLPRLRGQAVGSPSARRLLFFEPDAQAVRRSCRTNALRVLLARILRYRKRSPRLFRPMGARMDRHARLISAPHHPVPLQTGSSSAPKSAYSPALRCPKAVVPSAHPAIAEPCLSHGRSLRRKRRSPPDRHSDGYQTRCHPCGWH